MRTYNIALISPSAIPGSPSTIVLNGAHGDVTNSFHGKEWIDGASTRYPFYDFTAGATAVPGIANVGNGSVSSLTIDSPATAQTITITFTSSTAFTVNGSVAGALPGGTVGTAYNDIVNFTILAGATPFAIGDTFTITYTVPTAPYGTNVLLATTFDIIGNQKYQGRYTVFTVPTAGGAFASSFITGQTNIHVNEAMAIDGVGAELTSGQVSNISTYVYTVQGELSPLLVLEQQDYATRPVEMVGRQFSGWGEILNQNMLHIAQSFASSTPPTNPYLGQVWFNTNNTVLYVNANLPGTWMPINATIFNPYVHTQGTAALTWTVTHNFGTTSPFIVEASFFIDTGGGVYKPVIPSDVTYTNANQITVTFTAPQAGFVYVRRPAVGAY